MSFCSGAVNMLERVQSPVAPRDAWDGGATMNNERRSLIGHGRGVNGEVRVSQDRLNTLNVPFAEDYA